MEADAASVPASHKARLLLGLLAVERRVHGRSELSPGGCGRTSVRTALARACATRWRSCAARWVRRPSGWLPWTALASPWLLEVWTDLGEVERLLAVQQVEAALERCTGQVLAGFDEDWVQLRRAELCDRFVGALAAAAAAAEGAGDLDIADAV